LLVVLGWIELGPNLSTCKWFGWVSQLMGWVGLDRVAQNGPMDNCGRARRGVQRGEAIGNG